jgi:hypothetical protein
MEEEQVQAWMQVLVVGQGSQAEEEVVEIHILQPNSEARLCQSHGDGSAARLRPCFESEEGEIGDAEGLAV